MTDLLRNIIQMSVYGSIVILITILLRFFLRKNSKRFMMILWVAVALRLLLPINIESSLSLFNILPNGTGSAITSIMRTVPDTNVVLDQNAYDSTSDEKFNNVTNLENTEVTKVNAISEVTSGKTTTNKLDYNKILSILWLIGTSGILIYCAVRYSMLKYILKGSHKIDKNVYVSPKVASPFVLGLVKPNIYLPDTLSEEEREYVLSHERTHIRRGDWISKIVGVIAVAIHWFNPLVWLGFTLFEQDMEMSCDETTIENWSAESKAAYSKTLVSLATKSETYSYTIVPLGFSKVSFSKMEVTNRVKNIMTYKKGSKVLGVITATALILVATACTLNSKTEETTVKETMVSNPKETTEETILASVDVTEETFHDNVVVIGNDGEGRAELYTGTVLYDYIVTASGPVDENYVFDKQTVADEIYDILIENGYSEDSPACYFDVYENSEVSEYNPYPFIIRVNYLNAEDGVNKNSIWVNICEYDTIEDANVAFEESATSFYCDDKFDFSESAYRSFTGIQLNDNRGSYLESFICQKGNLTINITVDFYVSPSFSGNGNGSEVTMDYETFEKVIQYFDVPYELIYCK